MWTVAAGGFALGSPARFAAHFLPCNHTMLCHAVPRYAMLCHAVPCCAMLRHAVPCCAMLCHAVPPYAMLRHAVPCYAMEAFDLAEMTKAASTTPPEKLWGG